MSVEADVLIENGLIITVDASRRIITEGAIAIQGERIAAVGKTAELRGRFVGKRVIDARNRVVTPGFIDSHMHLTEGPRGFVPDNIPAVPWIYQWICPIFGCLNPDEEYLLSKLVITEALKTGTTTFVEGGTIKYPDSAISAVTETGIRANLGKWTWDAVDEPAIFRQSTDHALNSYEDLFHKYHGKADGRLNIWMHLIGVGTQSDSLMVGAKKLADRFGVGISQHQSLASEEVEEFVAKTGKRPIQHFAELGVLDKNVRFVHMIDLSSEEIDLLREFEVKLVHSPLTCLRLGYGATDIGRFPEIIQRGITVALCCDGANCSNTFDMTMAMYAAAGIYKDRYRNVNLIPAEMAIEMATINAAKSILMDDQIGSIETGKKADLVLFDRQRVEWLPMVNVINNLVYSADGRSVDTVIVNGKVVVEGQRMKTIDEEKLFQEIESVDWKRVISERTGLDPQMRWPVE